MPLIEFVLLPGRVCVLVLIKVADFGLSKLGKKQLFDDKSMAGHISTRVKGTLGE